MSKTNDGGPAFPTTWDAAHKATLQTEAGMSLRDWIAGQALANHNMCTGEASERDIEKWFGRSNVTAAEVAAIQAYMVADAMLAARSAS